MKSFKEYLEETKEIGHIISFSHSIAYVSGLPSLKLDEMIITESGNIGVTYGLEKNLAQVLMIDTKKIKVNEPVTRLGRELEIPLNEELLGRIINPLCQPLDGKGPIKGKKEYKKLKERAVSFIEREKINKPLETGVIMVDLLVPIGHGQRELIIGDAKTGKTIFLLQTIVNQAKNGTICIYTGIGKKDVAIKQVEDFFKKKGVLNKVIIVDTTPDDSPTLIYLAPYSGATIAEYFRDKGKDVLIIFDDLTTHAKIYRELSLLLKMPPGRECYPGDIFHLHAALLERAGNVKKGDKQISITALPVAETLENDIAGYIQTNLMSITDGHIFFDMNEFRKGKRPAINSFLSVSRVGNQTKTTVEKDLANWIRKNLIQYQDALEIAQFGGELPLETQKTIEFGKKIEVLFNQEAETIFPRELQLIFFALLNLGFWDGKSPLRIKSEILKILENYEKGYFPKLSEKIDEIKNLEHLQFLVKEILPEIEQYAKP